MTILYLYSVQLPDRTYCIFIFPNILATRHSHGINENLADIVLLGRPHSQDGECLISLRTKYPFHSNNAYPHKKNVYSQNTQNTYFEIDQLLLGYGLNALAQVRRVHFK